MILYFFFFSSRRRHTRFDCDWSSDVCSSDLPPVERPDREQRVGRHRHGRGGSMSVTAHPAPGTEEYQPVFTGKILDQLHEILTRYPAKQAALLPALWLVQQARGWISDRNMTEVAEVLGLTPAYVKGVVTFYTMFHQHPVGRHFVQVCTTSPCRSEEHTSELQSQSNLVCRLLLEKKK